MTPCEPQSSSAELGPNSPCNSGDGGHTSKPTILTCVADCKVGMRVRHVLRRGKGLGAGEGLVVSIGTDGVHVDFDKPSVRGIFNDHWFTLRNVDLELLQGEERVDEETPHHRVS